MRQAVLLVACSVSIMVSTAASAGPAPTPPPAACVPGDDCQLQPGALIRTPAAKCTAGFLFEDEDGNRYLSTAGHCVLEGIAATRPAILNPQGLEPEEATWDPHAGPWAADLRHRHVGSFVYAVVDQHAGLDFALIRLARPEDSSPTVRIVGGPSGMLDTSSDPTAVLVAVGNGASPGRPLPNHVTALEPAGVIDEVPVARPLLAARGASPGAPLSAFGVVVPGDSGGPVLDDAGRAVGVLSFFGAGPGGTVGIAAVHDNLPRAEVALGIDLHLLPGEPGGTPGARSGVASVVPGRAR